MKIFSAYVSNKIRKGLTVKREGNRLQFISFGKKSKNVYLSRFYPDFVFTTVQLPPVEDRDTFEFLLKNKIKGVLEENRNYLFLYFPVERISENEIKYDVYALPEEVYFETAQLLNLPVEQVVLFTLAPFSLIPFSQRLVEGVAFHFYADREKVIITVSEGDRPVYSRNIPVPEEIGEEYGELLYEHFNLTYTYISQNLQLQVKGVVLSGEAGENRELLESVRELTGSEPLVPSAETFIKGLSQKDFMEFFIPIGTAFLDERYDFSPYYLRKERKVNSLLKALTVFFLAIGVLGLVATYGVYSQYREKVERLKQIDGNIKKVKEEIKSTFGSPEEVDFFKRVFLLKNKAVETNPLYVFNKIYKLLALLEEEKLELYTTGNLQQIFITAEHSFDSVSEMVNFRDELNNILDSLKEFKIDKKVSTGKDGFSLSVILKLERRIDERE
ncbi:MAG: hypothetical protein GXN94_03945 [Aquificae bacterium]|nr:hypothetical protein [Aquificota bacterium]